MSTTPENIKERPEVIERIVQSVIHRFRKFIPVEGNHIEYSN